MPLQVTNSIAKYLGMPTTMRRARSQDFKFIMDKIWGKLKGWKERNLSFAGRSVLISAVIQAIPTYMPTTGVSLIGFSTVWLILKRRSSAI
jgi:hypothetical protein